MLFATQFTRQAKESWLKDAQGLPGRYAPYALVRLDRLEKAVELLEAGLSRSYWPKCWSKTTAIWSIWGSKSANGELIGALPPGGRSHSSLAGSRSANAVGNGAQPRHPYWSLVQGMGKEARRRTERRHQHHPPGGGQWPAAIRRLLACRQLWEKIQTSINARCTPGLSNDHARRQPGAGRFNRTPHRWPSGSTTSTKARIEVSSLIGMALPATCTVPSSGLAEYLKTVLDSDLDDPF